MNLEEVQKAIADIDPQDVNDLKSLLEAYHEIILIGNGGSNAICSHIAQDYTKILGKRACAFSDASRLTCYINDFGMESAYEQFIRDFHTDHTLIILISSSGNSSNIVRCADYCVSAGLPLIILTGFDAHNEVREVASVYAEIDMHVDSTSYGVVECVHQIFLHTPV
jgi:D-sedoheptulose 7-phosphate isomerase